MVFVNGKCYKHTTGTQIKVIGEVNSTLYGHCLMAEDSDGRFYPVGKTEDNAFNWSEISEEEWLKNFN